MFARLVTAIVGICVGVILFWVMLHKVLPQRNSPIPPIPSTEVAQVLPTDVPTFALPIVIQSAPPTSVPTSTTEPPVPTTQPTDTPATPTQIPTVLAVAELEINNGNTVGQPSLLIRVVYDRQLVDNVVLDPGASHLFQVARSGEQLGWINVTTLVPAGVSGMVSTTALIPFRVIQQGQTQEIQCIDPTDPAGNRVITCDLAADPTTGSGHLPVVAFHCSEFCADNLVLAMGLAQPGDDTLHLDTLDLELFTQGDSNVQTICRSADATNSLVFLPTASNVAIDDVGWLYRGETSTVYVMEGSGCLVVWGT